MPRIRPALLVILLVVAASGSGQEQERFRFRAEVRILQLDVIATDEQGRFVADLREDELELYDDETQKVMERNLKMSREIEENRIAEAVQVALDRAKEATG